MKRKGKGKEKVRNGKERREMESKVKGKEGKEKERNERKGEEKVRKVTIDFRLLI